MKYILFCSTASRQKERCPPVRSSEVQRRNLFKNLYTTFSWICRKYVEILSSWTDWKDFKKESINFYKGHRGCVLRIL